MNVLTIQSHCLRPCLYICSHHPLVVDVLGKIVSSHAFIEFQGAPSSLAITSGKRGCQILLVDSCSEEQWPAVARHWKENRGPVIVLVMRSPDFITELHAIYLGAHGVVVNSPNLERDLPEAIHAVANGQLWMRPAAMAEYARRSFDASKNIVPGVLLTDREQQVVKLIQEHFSNKHIAAALQISERTVKFHVSNILQKFRVKNRSSLFGMRLSTAFDPESDYLNSNF